MPIYDEVNGVARAVSKMYDEVDGVARQTTKVYDEVDGVARQTFLNGITWDKYTGQEVETVYEEINPSSETISNQYAYYLDKTNQFWDGYTFQTKYTGYVGLRTVDAFTSGMTISQIRTLIQGKYRVTKTSVQIVETVTSRSYGPSGDANPYVVITWTGTEVAAAKEVPVYRKIAYQGTVEGVPEGELPEDGTLLSGDSTSDYCVIQVGSQIYYYERIE